MIKWIAREVAMVLEQEGPQYSIYQKRDQSWFLKLQLPKCTRVNLSVTGRKFHLFKMKIDVKEVSWNSSQTVGLAPFQFKLQAILNTKK